MSESVQVEQPIVLDLLDTSGTPALSATSDMPVVETRPDATPAETAEPTEPAAEPQDSQASPTEEPAAAPAEPEPKGVGKRLKELETQRERERERAQAAEARLDRALQALEQFGGQKADPEPLPQADPEPVKPSRADYQDDGSFAQAVLEYADQKSEWVARHEVARQAASQAQAATASEVEQAQKLVRETYLSRAEKAKETLPDFDSVAQSPDVQISIPMASAILHSEQGPQVQYYLGKNPSEAARIMALPPVLQLVELGKIEARLNAPEPAPNKPVSNAPPPIKPIEGASRTAQKSPESMTMSEYVAWRQSQMKQDRSRARH